MRPCSAEERVRNRPLVRKWVVGVKIEIFVSVSGLSVHAGADRTVRFTGDQNIQKRDAFFALNFHCEVYALFGLIKVLEQILNPVLGTAVQVSSTYLFQKGS